MKDQVRLVIKFLIIGILVITLIGTAIAPY